MSTKAWRRCVNAAHPNSVETIIPKETTMSNPSGFDFTQFVPGFDYLKNLTPGASSSAAAPGWVAPTLDPEELDKRIQELKTVQFWLEQNAKAVGATIQALEVQRMTLATLKGMNMSFHDLAESLKVKPTAHSADAYDDKHNTSHTATSQTTSTTDSTTAPHHDSEPNPIPSAAQKSKGKASAKAKTATSAAGVDPAHWWGALTHQFQHIAQKAMTDIARTAQHHSGGGQASATSKKAPAAAVRAKKASAKKSAASVKPATSARKATAKKPAQRASRTASQR